MQEWEQVNRQALLTTARNTEGVTLLYQGDDNLVAQELDRLVIAEQDCCGAAGVEFALTRQAQGVSVRVLITNNGIPAQTVVEAFAAMSRSASTIKDASTSTKYIAQLREWFEAEWGQVDTVDNPATPAPLIALDSNANPIAGLAFTSATSPRSEHLAIWINALYVVPTHRNQGLASKLIKRASIDAAKEQIPEVFAYTNVPKLYENLGWKVVLNEGEHFTLSLTPKTDGETK